MLADVSQQNNLQICILSKLSPTYSLMLHLNQIAQFCKAHYIGSSQDDIIQILATDSRLITEVAHTMFVAITTNRSDGHQYIADAYAKGIRAFLVSQTIDSHLYPNAVFLQVPDTLIAMHQIAIQVRQQFTIPVIGITGSNGKTIVKEWLNALLSGQYQIVRSPKSYNSQIGVPLSVWQMSSAHNLAIFEAGISQPGEMDLLEKMIRPSIGIFTNIGEAHNQGFIHQRQKINEKLQLFRHSDTLIYCSDYHDLNESIALFAQNLKVNTGRVLQLFSWSFKSDAHLCIQSIEKQDGKSLIKAIYQNHHLQISIPFTDAASIENAIHCWCLMLHLELPQAFIQQGMDTLKPIAMRLELRQGENNCIIINDAYNADLTSLHIALDMLDQQKQEKSKTLILSDMEQTGRAELALYTEVAAILKERSVDRFIGIGAGLVRCKAIFEQINGLETHFFEDTASLIKHFHELVFENEAILLKGARNFAFEKIGLLLEQKIHQTVMTVNLSALRNNLEAYRRRLKPGVKTMAMVKASSYGSGAHEIAHVLQAAQVDYLTVAYVDEGVALRKAGIELPIMVMSPSTESFDRMILWRLEPEIFNMRSLQQFIHVAQNLGVTQYPIHIKLDTGMHRLGFVAQEIDALLAMIKDQPCMHIASIFSHFAAADDATFAAFTRQQAQLFIQMHQRIIAAIGYKPLLHICNSAGIVQYPEYHFDMVRLGLGLYGIDATSGISNQLQPISTLRSTIAQIKHIPAGETIGYSRKGKAEKDIITATISIGYADGYPRALSKSDAYVMINNKPAKLIGAIAMDMCMVDITGIDAVAEGDEVIIFGDALPIEQVAAWAGTIPYEIMTGVSQRVKRVYINEA